MNTFKVDLNILDVCCCKCSKSRSEKSVTIINSSTVIPLQNCYYLKVAYVSTNRALIIIKKDYYYIIRFVFLDIPTNICLPTPDNCTTHYLTITATSIATN